MLLKKVHTFSGVCISLFVGLHLFNHSYSILGADKHIELMNTLRYFYRNIFAETILLLALLIQIISGWTLFKSNRKRAVSFFNQLQTWTGLYLAFFIVVHISAIFFGRLILDLDTNLYFGAAGLNHFPVNLFFIPYYALAIISFFGHISAIHSKKMKQRILGLSPLKQSIVIFVTGICVTILILYGLTNRLTGFTIPAAYHVLTGQ